jgi:arylsulfatase A-like enzyme
VELYDLEADPWELTNVAAKPEHEATLARLRTQLDAWMRQQGDEGDATERRALERQGRR